MHGPAALRYDKSDRSPDRARGQCFNGYKEARVHRPNHQTEGDEMSHPHTARTSRQLKLVPLNKHEIADQVAEALRQDFGARAAKHKVIAEAAGAASENTAKAWTQKSNLPALEYFLELGRRSPALRAMTMRLWEMEHEMDPGMQKAWIEFCQMMARAGTK